MQTADRGICGRTIKCIARGEVNEKWGINADEIKKKGTEGKSTSEHRKKGVFGWRKDIRGAGRKTEN